MLLLNIAQWAIIIFWIIINLLSFARIPTAGVGPDWPNNIYFTFQFYRFPPVTSQRLKLLTSDKVQLKASIPCVLASINKDGTVNSGKDPPLQEKIILLTSSLKWRLTLFISSHDTFTVWWIKRSWYSILPTVWIHFEHLKENMCN